MFDSIVSTDITWMTYIWGTIVAIIFSAIGGVIGGIIIGAEHLGKELAAMMGGMFGPVAAAPGILIALFMLSL